MLEKNNVNSSSSNKDFNFELLKIVKEMYETQQKLNEGSISSLKK